MPVNYNGIVHDADAVDLPSNNRAFRYGDAIFESIRVFDGKLVFWEEHWKRLRGGAEYLRFDNLQSGSFYKNEIQKCCRQEGNWRVRLTLLRDGGGLYTPQTSQTRFLVESSPLETNCFSLNTAGLKVDTCDTFRLPAQESFNWKTANSLFYVLAGLYKRDKHLDDCLLLNDKGQIAEASSSNVFVLREDFLLTPPLRSGCKAGTMRSIIMKLAPSLNLEVKEKKIKEKRLFEADEIWLSNAIRGLNWVGQFREQNYQGEKAGSMLALLNQQISAT